MLKINKRIRKIKGRLNLNKNKNMQENTSKAIFLFYEDKSFEKETGMVQFGHYTFLLKGKDGLNSVMVFRQKLDMLEEPAKFEEIEKGTARVGNLKWHYKKMANEDKYQPKIISFD